MKCGLENFTPRFSQDRQNKLKQGLRSIVDNLHHDAIRDVFFASKTGR